MQKRDERGMSLLELLITMLITPLLVGAISLGLLQAFATQAAVSSQMNGTSNSTIDEQQLIADVQGASEISPTELAGGDAGFCANEGTQFLTLTQSNGDFVGYVEVGSGPNGSAPYALIRNYCIAADNTSTPAQSTTMLTGLATEPAAQLSIACAPDNTAASCLANETASTGSSGKAISWIASGYVTSVTAPVDGSSDVANHAATASTITVALSTYTPAGVNQPSTTASTTTTTLGATGSVSGIQPGGITPAPPTATTSPLILLGANYPAAQGTAGTTCNPVLLHLGAGSVLNVAAGAGDIAVNAACDGAVVLDAGAAPRIHGVRGPGHGPGARSGPGKPFGPPAHPIVTVPNSTTGATSQINGATLDAQVTDPLASGATTAVPSVTAPTATVNGTCAWDATNGRYLLAPGLFANGVYGLGTNSPSSACAGLGKPAANQTYDFTYTGGGSYQFGASSGAAGGLFNVEGSSTVVFDTPSTSGSEVYFADGFEAGQNASVTFGSTIYLLGNISNLTRGACSARPDDHDHWWKGIGPAGPAGPGFLGQAAPCNPGPDPSAFGPHGPLGCDHGATEGTQGSFSVFGNASVATSASGGALFYVMPNNGGFNIATSGAVSLQGLGSWNGANYQGLSIWDPNASATSQVLISTTTAPAGPGGHRPGPIGHGGRVTSTGNGTGVYLGGIYVPNQQVVIGQAGLLTAKYMVVQSLSFIGNGTLDVG